MQTNMRFFGLFLLLIASPLWAQPKTHVASISIAPLPESCDREILLQTNSDWEWTESDNAELSVTVAKTDTVFVASITVENGTRTLQESNCTMLLQAVAAITPILWQAAQVPVPSRSTTNSVSGTSVSGTSVSGTSVSRTSVSSSPVRSPVSSSSPAPEARSEDRNASSLQFSTTHQPKDAWFGAISATVSGGELPGIAPGGGIHIGRDWGTWALSSMLEYGESELVTSSPMANVQFTKVTWQPTICAFRGKKYRLSACSGLFVGVLWASPNSVQSVASRAAYAGGSADIGLGVVVSKRTELTLNLSSSVPFVGRRYSFSPSPVVYSVSGFSVKSSISLRLFFSDRY